MRRFIKKDQHRKLSMLIRNILIGVMALTVFTSLMMIMSMTTFVSRLPGTIIKQPSIVSNGETTAEGPYRFTILGFGHGVGMSQMGAIALAEQGWDYEQILKHYFYDEGIAISTHSSPPAYVTHEGREFELREYLARITYREIGTPNNVPREAMLAQMIIIYTTAKRNNFRTTENNHHILSDADWNSRWARQFHDEMLALANEVLGLYISFNGTAANALFFAASAGYTASAQWAWSDHEPAPYLTGGRWSPETIHRSNTSFTTEQIQLLVSDYNSRFPDNRITLGEDASEWIRILSVDPNGFVEQIQIGDRVFTGGNARMHFFGSRVLRSHNFTVEFING